LHIRKFFIEFQQIPHIGPVPSVPAELAKGKTLEEAKKITWKEAADALGGLPAIKAHCSVLAVEGLKSAIQNYEEILG
jgi:nitrogen fixation protein NifU and related proteins